MLADALAVVVLDDQLRVGMFPLDHAIVQTVGNVYFRHLATTKNNHKMTSFNVERNGEEGGGREREIS